MSSMARVMWWLGFAVAGVLHNKCGEKIELVVTKRYVQ